MGKFCALVGPCLNSPDSVWNDGNVCSLVPRPSPEDEWGILSAPHPSSGKAWERGYNGIVIIK